MAVVMKTTEASRSVLHAASPGDQTLPLCFTCAKVRALSMALFTLMWVGSLFEFKAIG